MHHFIPEDSVAVAFEIIEIDIERYLLYATGNFRSKVNFIKKKLYSAELTQVQSLDMNNYQPDLRIFDDFKKG
ncbi:Hypothetical predicted protein [Octopus vulgaris]|uniref:Uncharacterized protein n=1 Tax=Octopus vulgaris TaxID=6645 RepID=A0AA36BET4_OCTVU|nr:Hypothetical predicted protein [Octopus vulgaris]